MVEGLEGWYPLIGNMYRNEKKLCGIVACSKKIAFDILTIDLESSAWCTVKQLFRRN